MSRTLHIHQSVSGALINWCDQDWEDATKWISENGRRFTASELRRRFVELLASGVEALPIGGQCDNFDPKRGCLGHDDPPSPAAGIESPRAAGERER